MEVSQLNNDVLSLNSSRLMDRIHIGQLQTAVENLRKELASVQRERLQLQIKALEYLEMIHLVV